jgi:hypothetical protein
MDAHPGRPGGNLSRAMLFRTVELIRISDLQCGASDCEQWPLHSAGIPANLRTGHIICLNRRFCAGFRSRFVAASVYCQTYGVNSGTWSVIEPQFESCGQPAQRSIDISADRTSLFRLNLAARCRFLCGLFHLFHERSLCSSIFSNLSLNCHLIFRFLTKR